MTLVLHPLTEQRVQAYRAKPSHAVILLGAAGSGKHALAEQMVASALKADVRSHPYVMQLDGGQNGIEDIRQLEQFLARKVPGDALYNRAVIIDAAHNLAHEAQNALLKTLEEPPAGTVLILTAAHKQGLLPTIQSRSQVVQLQTPSKQQLVEHFSAEHSAAEVAQAYAMSGGLPGLMTALLEDHDHPLRQAAQMARDILTGSSVERLALVDKLAKDKDLARNAVFILQQMAHIKLQTASGAAGLRWQRVLQAAYDAAEAMSLHAQTKLVLTTLMLRLA